MPSPIPALHRATTALLVATLLLIVGALEAESTLAQTPGLAFDPPFGACEDAELTIRGDGFPAGTTVGLFGGDAEGPALDRFALTVEEPEVDLAGSFTITLDRLPILCTTGSVGIFALAATTSDEIVAQARAVYFVAVQPPATGNAGAAERTASRGTAPSRTALAVVALLAVLASTGAARNRLRAKD